MDEYNERLGMEINFDKTNYFEKKLIVFFIIGLLFSVLYMAIAFVNSTHYFGFSVAIAYFILGLVG